MIGMSICSGIGAPEVSAPWIDWRYQSEIEKFPCAVLAHRFPEATNLGDMTKFEEWPDAAIDVLVGGTPCQDYSVAGQRLGMAGDRGQLTLTYIEILARLRPKWMVFENVPGLLSSNGGRDFARFLGDISGQRIDPPENGWKNSGIVGGIDSAYGLAWRVLDAYDLGSPLPRPRVFVVGYSGGWPAAASVLFDRQDFNHASPRSRRGTRGHTLSAQNAGCRNGRGNAVCVQGRLRGLTPLETERCLGFPDGWTQIPWRKKPRTECPDGPRYKALGNSWAVNCGSWIFDRIKMVEEVAA